MTNDNIAILDIGTTKIVALVGRKNENGEIQILGYAERKSKGMNRGLVQNIIEASSVIREVTNEVMDKTGVHFDKVYVGIAGQHIESRQTQHAIMNESGEMIKDELISKLINDVYTITIDAGKKILHVFPQWYYVDNRKVENPVGMIGKQISGTFHISVARADSLKILYKSVQEAGLQIVNIILEPVASATSVLTPTEKEAGVALLDIGGGTTDLIIFKDNIIKHTAVIPVGGKTITQDIAEGCKTTFEVAEELKIEHGTTVVEVASDDEIITIQGIGGREGHNVSQKFIANIIEARMQEIIDTAYLEIGKAQMKDKLSAGLTITGGGALLRDCKQFAEFRTGLGTRIGGPTNFVFSNSDVLNNPKYATAVGLLQKAFFYKEKSEKEIKKPVKPEDPEPPEVPGKNKKIKKQHKQREICCKILGIV